MRIMDAAQEALEPVYDLQNAAADGQTVES
jgi:hypothetical protein